MTIKKKKKLYEGKAKILYSTGDSYSLIQHFKDEATAFNAKKKEVIAVSYTHLTLPTTLTV